MTSTLIALTGWGNEEDRRRSREAGIDHHLVKPVDLNVLEDLPATRPREPRAERSLNARATKRTRRSSR